MKSTSEHAVIAVDGPAGSGKSTVCRALAKRLGFVYLDTGAIYRAVGLALQRHGYIEDDPTKRSFSWMCYPSLDELFSLPLKFVVQNHTLEILYNSHLLGKELRTLEASRIASYVSSIETVRKFAYEIQRHIAKDVSVVAEGRDATTVVFPQACLKVFLTARPEVRAQRRFEEYRNRGENVSFEEVFLEITKRDKSDSSRCCAPLTVASDAIVVDTSEMEIEEVIDYLIKLAHLYCNV